MKRRGARLRIAFGRRPVTVEAEGTTLVIPRGIWLNVPWSHVPELRKTGEPLLFWVQRGTGT